MAQNSKRATRGPGQNRRPSTNAPALGVDVPELRQARALWSMNRFEECLRAKPDYHEAQLMKARLLRRLKQDTGCNSILQALTDNDQIHPLIRAQAWAEIAQACDRAGDYAEAMRSMVRGKELLRER